MKKTVKTLKKLLINSYAITKAIGITPIINV